MSNEQNNANQVSFRNTSGPSSNDGWHTSDWDAPDPWENPEQDNYGTSFEDLGQETFDSLPQAIFEPNQDFTSQPELSVQQDTFEGGWMNSSPRQEIVARQDGLSAPPKESSYQDQNEWLSPWSLFGRAVAENMGLQAQVKDQKDKLMKAQQEIRRLKNELQECRDHRSQEELEPRHIAKLMQERKKENIRRKQAGRTRPLSAQDISKAENSSKGKAGDQGQFQASKQDQDLRAKALRMQEMMLLKYNRRLQARLAGQSTVQDTSRAEAPSGAMAGGQGTALLADWAQVCRDMDARIAEIESAMARLRTRQQDDEQKQDSDQEDGRPWCAPRRNI